MAELADYVAFLERHLPRGRAWEGLMLKALNCGLAASFYRVGQRLAALPSEYFPDSTTELLPEWAAVLGLEARDAWTDARSQITGRLARTVGHSKADYLKVICTTVPSQITIEDFERSRAGMRVGVRAWSGPWEHVWQISHIPQESLGSVRQTIEGLVQAHTHVIYREEETHVSH